MLLAYQRFKNEKKVIIGTTMNNPTNNYIFQFRKNFHLFFRRGVKMWYIIINSNYISFSYYYVIMTNDRFTSYGMCNEFK